MNKYLTENPTLKVIVIEPGKFAKVQDIENTIESFQTIVGGGLFQVNSGFYFKDNIDVICNDLGHIKKMPLNRALLDDYDNIMDTVPGTFFLAYCKGEDYYDMPKELIDKYLNKFYYPHKFTKDGDYVNIYESETEFDISIDHK